jgi:hypothetical protein
MAHWAELDENNVVIRVLVGDNDDPNGDEGYQWLIDNLGGRWVKTSYNTFRGKHLSGGTPFRGNYAGNGYVYDENLDAFLPPKEFDSWIVDEENFDMVPPIPRPDSGIWLWNQEIGAWEEFDG